MNVLREYYLMSKVLEYDIYFLAIWPFEQEMKLYILKYITNSRKGFVMWNKCFVYFHANSVRKIPNMTPGIALLMHSIGLCHEEVDIQNCNLQFTNYVKSCLSEVCINVSKVTSMNGVYLKQS